MRADSHEKAKTTELGDSQLSVDTCQLKMWGKDNSNSVYTYHQTYISCKIQTDIVEHHLVQEIIFQNCPWDCIKKL